LFEFLRFLCWLINTRISRNLTINAQQMRGVQSLPSDIEVGNVKFAPSKQSLIMNEPENQKIAREDNTVDARPSGNSEHPQGGVERRGIARLFLDFYGLHEQPFGVTPDLRFLYLGAKHRQALDVLNYGTELNRGFLTLIAKPGMGKTSLLFHYLEGLRDKARTVFLFQTDGDSRELMTYVLADVGLNGKGMDLPEMRAVLSQVLMKEMQAGRRFVLVIDEAQNLDEKVLESIRLLSNCETPWMKLMHIVLAGQPQLADLLAKPSMAQFRQRVSFAIRIEPFTRDEVNLYIDHRLWVAGYKGTPLFSIGARNLIAERSEGIPRVINNMCFCAMSYAWAMKCKTVDAQAMSEVLADLEPRPPIEKIQIEREVLAPKLAEKPKLGDSHTAQTIGLTLKHSPAQGGFSKFVVVCFVLLSLGWVGLQPKVETWIGSSYNSIWVAVRSFLVPTPAPSSLAPALTVGPHTPSTNSGAEVSADEKDTRAPRRGVTESSSKSGGHN
jgi:type II secretory pathway predicted ATPase ExeA